MHKKYQEIFNLAVPYLQKGTMKDFVLHTQSVVLAMQLLIEGEGGDADILVPAAILHDVGFSKVAPDLQTNAELEKKREAQRQHLVFASSIVKEVLEKVFYPPEKIDKIIEIIEAHKFQNPPELEKRMLIDADNLSDTFPEQFSSDVKAYKSTPEQVYEYRTKNEYYTKTAKNIATVNMAQLKATVENNIS